MTTLKAVIYDMDDLMVGCLPYECLVLEDAKNGIKSAKDAGCKCIAVRNPNTPKQDLSESDLIINSLEDISLKTIKNIS